MQSDPLPELAPYQAYGAGDPGRATFEAQLVRSFELFDHSYAPFLPASCDARVLEIGCGTGPFIAWLRRKGYGHVHGVDHSPTMVQVAHTHLGPDGIELIDDLADWLDRHVGEFDVVASSQVMEHFTKADMARYLPRMVRALKPGGVFMTQVPNMCAFAGLRDRYIDFTHEVGFTEVSLAQVLRLAGLDRIQMLPTHMPMRGGVVRRVFRLLQRLQQAWLSAQYWIALGTDRPRVLTGNLMGIAYRPKAGPD